MAKTVGADSARVAILDDNEKVDLTKYSKDFGNTGIFDINAKTSEGLISAAIAGLAPTLNKIYGSDMVVETSGKGAGAVAVTLAANDIPDAVLNDLAGMKQDETSGAYYIDTETRPPYASLEMTSHDNKGNKVHFCVPKGTFGPEEHNLQTNTDTEQIATDSVTFTGVNRKSDKKIYLAVSEGQSGYSADKWDALIFPGAAAASSTTSTPSTGQ